jgi:hypothetical protein
MKWIWPAATLLLFISGCTGKNESLPPVPDPNAAIVMEIKRQVLELERNSAIELTTLRNALEKVSKESESDANDLQQQILLKDQRIAGLETQIQQLQSEIRNLKRAQEQQKIDRPANPPPPVDPFPIRIFGVEGRKVVTGNHATVREVETDETYKNVFGDKVKRTRMENVQVDDYGYQAGFSVENPTQAPVEISVSAGLKTGSFIVPAGQVLNNLAVDSAMGADLAVMVGGYTRRFSIAYTEGQTTGQPGPR